MRAIRTRATTENIGGAGRGTTGQHTGSRRVGDAHFPLPHSIHHTYLRSPCVAGDGTEDTAAAARCLYYWRAELPESDEEAAEEPAAEPEPAAEEPAAEAEPELEPTGDADSEPVAAADAVEPIDFGAGWTFGALESLGPAPSASALARTKSVAQPPSLGCGDGGRSAQPFVSKMFPPEGAVSFVSAAGQVWDVTIGRTPPPAAAERQD